MILSPAVSRWFTAAAAALVLFAFSCNRGVTTVPSPIPGIRPVTVESASDTVSYVLAFDEKGDRQQFVKTFDAFLERYPFGLVKKDTLKDVVYVRVLPPAEHRVPDSMVSAPVDRGEFVESLIAEAEDTLALPRPAFGGRAVVYSDRGFWDEHLAGLVQSYPFGVPAEDADSTGDTLSPPGMLTPRYVSAKRLSIALSGSLTNAADEPVSAFDLLEQWTAFVREHPAEGLALFRHVKGMRLFVEGREAVIPGLVANGQHALTVILEQEDNDALARLSTPRLLPSGLKLGPYAIKQAKGSRYVAVPNRNRHVGPPFLEQCTVVLGGDRNPFLSFSLGKYDCVTLSFREDVEYARRSLGGSVQLSPLAADRYFLSLNSESMELRRYLCSLANPNYLLNSVVKAEGAVIGAIATEGAPALSCGRAVASVPADGPVAVLYRKGDPISARIAEKLLADLSQAGMRCELHARTGRDYEAALVDRAFTVAVGWVGAKVLTDRSEQLRLATMWFGDRTVERDRIDQAFEVPLFAVRRFAISRNEVAFLDDTISGMYVRSVSAHKE